MANRELAEQISKAYPPRRRIRDAHRFIRTTARDRGPCALERTKARLVAMTYGLGPGGEQIVKRMKAKYRTELSFSDGGK